ncbi:MAG: hypothetical protein ABFC84_15820 [Veillonellales bacterium]
MPKPQQDLAFRVLDSAPFTAAEHMALDEVIVKAHSEGLIPNTLRFLQFKPCTLVGRHQNVYLEVNVPYCREHGLDINRRITGGGSLYWGPLELGWSLHAAKNTPGIPRKVEDMYRLLLEGTAKGLQKLGLAAAYRPFNDIEIKGQKIAGSGGTELNHSFMFQCSLLVDFDIREMVKALRFPVEKMSDKAIRSMDERVTSLHKQLGYIPAHRDIKQAVLSGLREALKCTFYPGERTAAEQEMFQKRLPYIQSEEWIYGTDSRVVNTLDCLASYKAPGGLIRIQMRLDDKIQVIKYVIITGDFFAYPARMVNDLETALKNTPIDRAIISWRIHDFFAGSAAEIPGVAAEDFIAAVWLAVERAKAGGGRPITGKAAVVSC